MESLSEKEIQFINNLSISNLINNQEYSDIELPKSSNYLSNDIEIEYIDFLIKDIDIRLYLNFISMIKNNISFIDNYDCNKSVCELSLENGATTNTMVYVPMIKKVLIYLSHLMSLGMALKHLLR